VVPLVIPPTGKNLKVVSSILCMAILIAQRQSEPQGEDHDTLDNTQKHNTLERSCLAQAKYRTWSPDKT
jgi:hypothetical protein